ncbi:precorrin-2 dehydrogenase/sirohydrochlorin ferrochelatase family protein [Haloparvum sp. PAK95]|uniref:precorrin-2 dehydrogenase/sirohydrochlorin ferrochelatase family protein n=1 Tax=Haloparvum sp. PAK95 TaxID=3418962 RepID=UPI003D2EBD7B
MIPLVHDFAGETVLVVGGGSVGSRKARRFASEADVVVVSPRFAEDLREFEVGTDGDAAVGGSLELVREAVDADDVDTWVERTDPALVVAATDDAAINAAAEAAARKRGALINRTDESGARDADSVVVPATVEEDPVTVAISSGGTSPALSRYLRQRIEAEIEGAGAMAELTGELREELQAEGVDPDVRRDAIRAVVRSSPVWKALQAGDTNARQEAERVVQKTCRNS